MYKKEKNKENNFKNKSEYFYIETSRINCLAESDYSAQFLLKGIANPIWIPIKHIYGRENIISLKLKLMIFLDKKYFISKTQSITGAEIKEQLFKYEQSFSQNKK